MIVTRDLTTMRATAGVFIWAIESTLLALVGVGIISLINTITGSSPIAVDMWAVFVTLISCVFDLMLNTFIAFSSKQSIIQGPSASEAGESDSRTMFLHKSVTQGHSCVVAIILVLYCIIMQQSLVDLNWASAFYPSSPGLVWIAGSVTLAFLTVLFTISITGAWAATALGDSNPIFFIVPTTAIICIMFPILNEIGNNGLMACSSPMVSTVAIIYANLALATSFTLSLLDNVEFDPVKLLPKFMRTVGDRAASIRIYSLIHGGCISVTMVLYWMSARKVSSLIIFALIIVNGVVTLTISLPFILTLVRLSPNLVLKNPNTRANGEPDSGSDYADSYSSDSASNQSSSSSSGPVSNKPVVSAGPQRRTLQPKKGTTPYNQKNNVQLDKIRTSPMNPLQFDNTRPVGMSIAERRIAILRLNEDQTSRTRHT